MMMNTFKSCIWIRVISLAVLLSFSSSSVGFTQTAFIDNLATLNLPVPGTIVTSSPSFVPVLLKGMTIHPEDPFKLDFIVDSGNSTLSSDQIKKESERLVKYFMASMTVPKNDLWVNLSPYEKDRIIPEELGKTELGRDLLAQDYILKQLSASLIYPESDLGAKFWERVRQQAFEQYGIKDVPMSTFNKVWILPESATVYEHGNHVYIVEGHLKVMLEEDYLAKKIEDGRGKIADAINPSSPINLPSSLMKELIIPEIEKEVNQGKNFAPLRQIYHSLILAKWYKETIKQSLLSQMYVDQSIVSGIELNDPSAKEKIYDQYIEAYKKGVYNYMKEEYDQVSQEVIPRQYFSGGFTDADINIEREQKTDLAQLVNVGDVFSTTVKVVTRSADRAMQSTAQPASTVASLNGLPLDKQIEIVTKLQEQYNELLQIAGKDPLTGLPNAWQFAQRADTMLAHLARANYGVPSDSPQRETVHLVLLSIDHFKEVNDLFKHQTGDEVLKLFGSQLQKTLRPTDAIARLGGKEFALLLSNVTDKDAEKIVERIRANFKESLNSENLKKNLPISQYILDRIPNIGITSGVTSSVNSLILTSKEQRDTARETMSEIAYVALEKAKKQRDDTKKDSTVIELISNNIARIATVDTISDDVDSLTPDEKSFIKLHNVLRAKREAAEAQSPVETFFFEHDRFADAVASMEDKKRIESFEYFKRAIPLLNTQARFDPLTRLDSLFSFKEKLMNTMAELKSNSTRNSSTIITTAMADIDYFSIVNALLGKKDTDKVLQRMADILQNRLRPTDDVGRKGTISEEILFMLETDAVGAQKALNDIAMEIQKEQIEELIPLFPELEGPVFKQKFNKLWAERLSFTDVTQKKKLEKAVEMQLRLQGREMEISENFDNWKGTFDRWVVTFSAGVVDQTTDIIREELDRLDSKSSIPEEAFEAIFTKLFDDIADMALFKAKEERNKIVAFTAQQAEEYKKALEESQKDANKPVSAPNPDQESTDSAQLSNSDEVGGIDMNNIDVKRQGAGAPITFDPIDPDFFNKEGIQSFIPVIINVTPLPNLPMFLGLETESSHELKSSL